MSSDKDISRSSYRNMTTPWHVKPFDEHLEYVNDYLGVLVCSVRKDSFESHLIQAAPELLSNLERAVAFFEINGGDENFSWLPEMKSALAKAKGKV